MSFVSFTRHGHADPVPGALESDDRLLDPCGELKGIDAGFLTKPRAGERSCCCVAPPQVRVVLRVPGSTNRMVDLLLCGHHYRVSAKSLAALGALCINAPTATRNASPVSPVPEANSVSPLI